MTNLRLNVKRLLKDLGGPAQVAEFLGIGRTIPYRWQRSGYISSTMLGRIKQHAPQLDLDTYFEARTCRRSRKRATPKSIQPSSAILSAA